MRPQKVNRTHRGADYEAKRAVSQEMLHRRDQKKPGSCSPSRGNRAGTRERVGDTHVPRGRPRPRHLTSASFFGQKTRLIENESFSFKLDDRSPLRGLLQRSARDETCTQEWDLYTLPFYVHLPTSVRLAAMSEPAAAGGDSTSAKVRSVALALVCSL